MIKRNQMKRALEKEYQQLNQETINKIIDNPDNVKSILEDYKQERKRILNEYEKTNMRNVTEGDTQ